MLIFCSRSTKFQGNLGTPIALVFPAARENGNNQKKATPDGLDCSKKYT
jgi:hypothetical protein